MSATREITFHLNGKIHEVYFVKNGKKDGLYRSLYDNGQLGCERN